MRSQVHNWDGEKVTLRPNPAYVRQRREMNLAQRNEYDRNNYRRRNNIEYLIDFELEAENRGLTSKQLVRRLMMIISKDDLFDAILGKLVLAFLLLTSSPLLAQTTLVLLDSGPGSSLSISATVVAASGVDVRAFSSTPVKFLLVQGNGRVLASCGGRQVCDVMWQNSAMHSGLNDVLVTATSPTGQKTVLATKVSHP